MNTLYLVATPIGNLEDSTIRSLKTLFSVDYIACEDTRRTGRFLTMIQAKFAPIISEIEFKKPRLISFYDEVEEQKIPEIIALLEQKQSVALVSDAGTPLISDPGFKLVRECIKRNIKIVPLPGPSAVITALTVSGLPTDKFLFLGYLPAHKTKRVKLLKSILFVSQQQIQMLPFTVILYESPHRLGETLVDIKEVFGDITIVLARELTKIHEEILRGKVSFLQDRREKLQGELVLLLNIPQE